MLAASIMHRRTDQQDPLSNEVMHVLQEALTGRSACRWDKRCQQHQCCQMLSMTWAALCAWCSTGASSVLGHEVISLEEHLQTTHYECLTEERLKDGCLTSLLASSPICIGFHEHSLQITWRA